MRDTVIPQKLNFAAVWRKEATAMISQRSRLRPKMEHVDDVTRLTFTESKLGGEGNFIARELTDLTEGLGQRHLLLDFRNVDYVNSSELATIAFLSRKLKATGGLLTLVNVNHHIGEVFERTRLNTLIEIRHETLPRAKTQV